jgi:hypothetical protein
MVFVMETRCVFREVETMFEYYLVEFQASEG